MATTNVELLSPYERDGKKYAAGDKVAVDNDEVDSLLKLGVAKRVGAARSEADPTAEVAGNTQAESHAEAEAIIADARAQAEQIIADAHAEAEQIIADAHAEAEKVKADAAPKSGGQDSLKAVPKKDSK